MCRKLVSFKNTLGFLLLLYGTMLRDYNPGYVQGAQSMNTASKYSNSGQARTRSIKFRVHDFTTTLTRHPVFFCFFFINTSLWWLSHSLLIFTWCISDINSDTYSSFLEIELHLDLESNTKLLCKANTTLWPCP